VQLAAAASWRVRQRFHTIERAMRIAKKLIEVALPLEAINQASKREKSIRHGHPSTLHLWWSRKPTATARAVIFAQMVDDPSAHPDLFPTPEAQEAERRRLFKIIEDLVQWENTNNEDVLKAARDEIRASWQRTCEANKDHPRAAELFNPDKLPAFHDPFAGGGSLPLEAQRLGLEAWASDINPVAVLINKAMIEIPSRFANRPPVNPPDRQRAPLEDWRGARGLAADVRYYGEWMRKEAEKRIGHLYPKVEVTEEMAADRPDLKPLVGQKLTVIAWLWARTVRSPNPAFAGVEVPLASTFMLSTKAGKEAWVEVVRKDQSDRAYAFTVRTRASHGAPPSEAKNGTKLARGAHFRCVLSGAPIPDNYIKAEGRAGRMGARLMAIVAEGERGRVYLAPTPEHEEIARQAKPEWKPENELIGKCRDQLPLYGMSSFADLFTPRQLVALTTFADLVGEAMARVKRDALAAGLPDDGQPLRDGGTGATAYAEAVGVYLGLGVDRLADRSSTICGWDSGFTKIRNTFGRQALPMTWDYAEGNPFSDSTGNFAALLEWVEKFLTDSPAAPNGLAAQQDASAQSVSVDKLVSTDPPYYDNIGYADLSDFFYVWLRRSLRPVFPDLFATLAVPKAEELVATPYRHGSKEAAERFFLDGMTQAMHRLAEQAHPAFPVTIYYAFKQQEVKEDKREESNALDPESHSSLLSTHFSTGWETFLDAVIRAGFAISGTWPMRTELGNRMIGLGTNALASSIVLVCRPRPADAPTATRREFVQALKAELLPALAELQKANIAPVDLAQAAIGPGMAVYTRYAQVLDVHGRPVGVRDALALINQTLDEVLSEQEGDLDAETRWALTWFAQHGFEKGDFGDAEMLSKAKNTSIEGLVEAGILESKRGKVRLLQPGELPADWDPATDARLTVWEMVHHLARVLEARGEQAAAALLAEMGGQADAARELCYRLYTICERKGRTRESRNYNALVQSWPEIARLAHERARRQPMLDTLPLNS